MLRLAEDTTPEAEEMQIKFLREATPERRFRLAASLSATVRELAWEGIRRANPTLSEREINLLFVEYHYGNELAQALRNYLANK